ncbi:hypothetical protein ACFV6E_12565 [Streptomyces sp. NPDC059785]|uniref:hypothetical protein n=1 Tax=unclassified Streptomyces TaxID=2593676 RepID=UPI00365A2B32
MTVRTRPGDAAGDRTGSRTAGPGGPTGLAGTGGPIGATGRARRAGYTGRTGRTGRAERRRTGASGRPGAPASPSPRSSRTPRTPRTALRSEFRRGFAPWAAGALLVTLGWSLAATADQWQGSWGEVTDRLGTGAGLVGAPFALAAGAWQGGRERRARMTELRLSAPRGPLPQLLVAALPLACWLAAGYLVAVAGALLACAPYASAGGPAPAVFAGIALSLAACSVLGQVAGRVLPWRLTAPALAVCGYVLFGVLATETSSAVRFLALAHVRGAGDRESPLWWYPLVSAVWAVGLAAAAVLCHTARRRVGALLPLGAAFAAAALLVHTGDGLLRDNPLRHRQVCDGSTTPHVCVNATYPGMLPEVADALSGLTGRLDGVRNVPVRFEDLDRRPHRDEAQLPMLTPLGFSAVRGEVTDPARYAREAARLLVRPDCEQEPSAGRVRATDEAVLRWLAPDPVADEMRRRAEELARQQGSGDDSTGSGRNTRADEEHARQAAEDRAYDRLTALTGDERRTWLSRYFATARQCDPDASEVPSL